MNVVAKAKAHMITVILVLPQPHELLHYDRYPVLGIYEALSLSEQAGKSIPVGKKRKTNENHGISSPTLLHMPGLN
ncbi:hypothetical protein PAHAL_9G142700 [Panicum hallii]|uniref:Uncharacterized protein n=1 Tax=Panicum hallii TaxID=206008 RepID=A0A2T8I190_9POAL|nr:hypothetical protein PAHAL_9G142700 [Panicum hallii]